jgi:deazaflavin-dependent oxidoreductase (nitroreductase family)
MEDHDLEALRLEQVADPGGPGNLPRQKLFNAALIKEFRQNGGQISGQLAGLPLLLVTTTGTKTGRQRTTPLGYCQIGDRLIIIASKGGAPDHPAWYYNLLADPHITVELGHETFKAKAIITTGQDRDRLFTQAAQQQPAFADYQKTTPRQIPVIELTRTN